MPLPTSPPEEDMGVVLVSLPATLVVVGEMVVAMATSLAGKLTEAAEMKADSVSAFPAAPP